jgi:hypothetical protein
MSNNNDDIWAQRAAKQENLIQGLNHQNQSLLARQQNAANHHGEMLEQRAFKAMDAKRRDREESQQPTSTAPPKDEVGGSTLNISSFINGHPLNPARVVVDVEEEEEEDDTNESSTQIQGDESSSEDEEENEEDVEEEEEEEEEEYDIVINKFPMEPINVNCMPPEKQRRLAHYAELAHDIILDNFGLNNLLHREPMVHLRRQIYHQLHRLNSEMRHLNKYPNPPNLYNMHDLMHLGLAHGVIQAFNGPYPMQQEVLMPLHELFNGNDLRGSVSFVVYVCLNLLNDTIIKLCRLYNIPVVIPE